ncbi:MAG: GrpB family protein [Patescibacteria group bacterium]
MRNNIIGLKRGNVKLRKHNSNWRQLFKQEKELLLKRFPDAILEISHGGSTAIPTIPAKPIIDMFAVVSSLKDTEKIRKSLEEMGYEYRGEESVPERILYVKGKPKLRTHHLQLVERSSDEWKNHILIRDYFLKHPEIAKEYAKLKLELAKKYPNDRKSYSNGKDVFIKSIIQKAKEEN